MVAAALFCIGIVKGWLFLKVHMSSHSGHVPLLNLTQESLESKKNDRDYGLVIGGKITAWVRRTFNLPKPRKGYPEREPLLTTKNRVDDDEISIHEAREIREVEAKP